MDNFLLIADAEKIFLIVGILVAAWIVFDIVLAGIIFHVAFVRRKKTVSHAEETLKAYTFGLDREEAYFNSLIAKQVEILSFDGLKLKADFFDVENRRGTLIFMHGFQGRGRDFRYCVQFFHQRGFAVLLPDQRAHGKSEGRYLTFGVKEHRDCEDWVRLVAEELAPGEPIFLDGVSMGCTTVLLAENLPSAVKGVIADCGFTTPLEIVKYTARRTLRLPPFPCIYLVSLYARIFAGTKLKSVDTRKTQAKNDSIPVLFATGTRDLVVPPHMTEENFNACNAPKTLILTEGGHGVSVFVAREEYEKHLDGFLKGCLKECD